jgi:hypothetical protein
MNAIFYWVLWTSIATLGSKYSLEYLLQRDFAWHQIIIIVLTYEWFTALANAGRKTKDTKVKSSEPSVTINELNNFLKKKSK